MSESASKIRKVIYLVPEQMEVVEITWPPDSRSEKHDHGKSFGFTSVEDGEVFEIIDGRRLVHRKGETFTETPKTIHIVGSVHGARTRHFYSPPITGTMTNFPDE